MQSFELSPLIAGQKVHRYCEKLFPEMSRKEIFALIRHGNVKINKKKCAAEDLLPDTGTLTVWTSRTSQKTDTQHETNATSHPVKMIHPKRKTFEVLYEDDDLLVIDKPAGLPVHGGTGTKGRTLIQELRGYLWKEWQPVPNVWFFQRLDKNTAGVMICTKTHRALAEWNALQQNNDESLVKIYRARVFGTDLPDTGHITTPLCIEENPVTGQAKVRIAGKNDHNAKDAHTEYRVLRRESTTTVLEIILHTGRTHQIRVHCASIGAPLVGDMKYGDAHRNMQNNIREHQLLCYEIRYKEHIFRSRKKLEESKATTTAWQKDHTPKH